MNDDNATIRLAAGSRYVSITLDAPHGADEWQTMVAAGAGVFYGQVSTPMSGSELHALQHLLIDLDRKVGQPARAEWGSLEGEIALTFELSRLGHLQVQVDLYEGWTPATRLSFLIEVDQTYLPLWIRRVTNVLERLTS